MNYRLLLLFYFINCSLIAQEIALQLRDSLSGEPIPFATVMTIFG
jgi:hypothetical protein